MDKVRLKNVNELRECYHKNFNKEGFCVTGHGECSYAFVQEMYHLYDLNDRKLCNVLDRILKEYEVYFESHIGSCINIENVPEEIFKLVRTMGSKIMTKRMEKRRRKEEKILNELKEINVENIVEEMEV